MFASISKRRLVVWVGAAGLAVAGGAVTTTPAWSSSVEQCYVSGNAPYQSGSFIYGQANRNGCGDLVELQAWIMADLTLWPDPNVGIGTRRLVNGSVTGSGPCDREGREEYYTSARTDTGQKSDSQRRWLC